MDDINLRAPAYYINRELSFLEFNQRVVDLAQDLSVPLLERVRFLSIASSNLDEFFEIRVAGLKERLERGASGTGPDGRSIAEQLAAIHSRARQLVAEQYRILNDQLTPALVEAGIHLLQAKKISRADAAALEQYFTRDVADARERLVGRESVGSGLRDAERLLVFQSRDADLEELVEVRAADREEAQPFEERHGGVARLREDAPLELENRELPVHVVPRIGEVDRRLRRGLRVGHGRSRLHVFMKGSFRPHECRAPLRGRSSPPGFTIASSAAATLPPGPRRTPTPMLTTEPAQMPDIESRPLSHPPSESSSRRSRAACSSNSTRF